MATQALYRGTGRRKTAVARVRVMPGDGKITVNDRDYTEYFPRRAYQASVAAPLRALEAGSSYDIVVQVEGGGPHRTGGRRAARHSTGPSRRIAGGTRRT
jgi:small subunit ribosomal protein S9